MLIIEVTSHSLNLIEIRETSYVFTFFKYRVCKGMRPNTFGNIEWQQSSWKLHLCIQGNGKWN